MMADWPEGYRVIIGPAPDEGSIGVREDDWADTPEEIAEWLRSGGTPRVFDGRGGVVLWVAPGYAIR